MELAGISNKGVSIRAEGVFGVIILVSIYFSVSLDEYLRYIDVVLLLDNSSPIIVCTDANAASPLWFSEISLQARGYEYKTIICAERAE